MLLEPTDQLLSDGHLFVHYQENIIIRPNGRV